MNITGIVKKILNNYESESPGIKSNLCRILMHGQLAGTGNMVILPVDQGFEHGPARSFAKNPDAYDPYYHYELAISAKLNAYAAPLGFLEVGADNFAGQIPIILKMNNNNSLVSKKNAPAQAFTASVKDALRLGCVAVGLTIYPGSDAALNMIEEAKEIISEAKSYGLAVVVWSYPRGGDLSKDGETAVDVCAYAAHIAALIGANIIKIKAPSDFIELEENKKVYKENRIDISTLASRVKHIMHSCFNYKRLIVFSGGTNKSEDDLFNEIKEIKKGGASGSIIGRNSFQRPREEAIALLNKICSIYTCFT